MPWNNQGRSGVTISADVKPLGRGETNIFMAQHQRGRGYFLALSEEGDLSVGLKTEKGNARWYSCSGKTSLNENEFNHVVLVWSDINDKLKGYVNGLEICNTENVEGPLSDEHVNIEISQNHLYIGGSFFGDLTGNKAKYFRGEIKDIRLYNVALGLNQIQAIYLDIGTSSISDKNVPCENYGDLYEDNKIDSTDLQLFVFGEGLERGDVNGDGLADSEDLFILRDYFKGKISTFPVCENGDSKKEKDCSDSDGGKDYFVKGETTYRNSINKDICSNKLYGYGYFKDLIEYSCDDYGELVEEVYSCPYKCVDGACIQKPAEEKCPKGCIYRDDERCYSFGVRLNTLDPVVDGEYNIYCDPVTKVFVEQKSVDSSCENNYECKSNLCSQGICVASSQNDASRKAWCRIWSTISFGLYSYEDCLKEIEDDSVPDLDCNDPSVNCEIEIVGEEEIVFDWSEDACEEYHLPDTPARAFLDSNDKIQLIATNHKNRRMIGDDFNSLTPECDLIMPSNFNSDPSKFDDKRWLTSVYTNNGEDIYGLVHIEYQGDRHEGMCQSEKPNPTGRYHDCWYNSIGFVKSENAGVNYDYVEEPPEHVVASLPYEYSDLGQRSGYFSPSNMVYNPDDGYYYVMFYSDKERGEQKRGTCLMRTNDLEDVDSWRAWDGSSFSVEFINPYTTDLQESEISEHVCEPIDSNDISMMHDSLTYNSYLGKYILIGISRARNSVTNEYVTGIYYSFSDDLIDWTPRKLLFESFLPPQWEDGYPTAIAYPSIIDHNSPSRNFEITGYEAYLYYTRFNYFGESAENSLDRDLLRKKIVFSMELI